MASTTPPKSSRDKVREHRARGFYPGYLIPYEYEFMRGIGSNPPDIQRLLHRRHEFLRLRDRHMLGDWNRDRHRGSPLRALLRRIADHHRQMFIHRHEK